MTTNQVIEKLRLSNMKEVSAKTAIPYERMAKWVQGKGTPKTADFEKLISFFNGTLSINKVEGIPLVSTAVAAGFGSSSFSIVEDEIIARYIIPDFKDIDFMVRVLGNSMQGVYNSGDIVACRILQKPSFIQWGKAHVVATSQGIVIKRLEPSNKDGYYKFVSDNASYAPFEVSKAEISGIALVIGVVRLE